MASILLLVLFATLLVVMEAKRCEDDEDCKNNMFCYTATHNCVQCITCSEYQRHDKGFCVKEALQCGDCLDGFEPEILSDGVRDLCVPSSFSQPQPIMTAQLSWQPWVFSVCGFGLVACAIFASFKWKDVVQVKYRSRFPEAESTSSSSSALYAPSAPVQPSYNGGSGELPVCSMENEKMIPSLEKQHKNVISGYIYEKHNENLQMASKFCSPSYVFNSPDDEPIPPLPNNEVNPNNGGEPDIVDGPGPTVPTVPSQDFLIEEDTLPSDWSPGPEYPLPPSTNNVPLVTSFSNILLNEARSSSGPGGSQQSSSANHSAHSNTRENSIFINVTNNTVINNGSSNTAGVTNITNKSA